MDSPRGGILGRALREASQSTRQENDVDMDQVPVRQMNRDYGGSRRTQVCLSLI